MTLEQTLIFALAIVAVWRIVVLITTNPKVILTGKVPGKVAIMGVSGLIFAGVYLYSGGLGLTQYIGAAMLFVCTMLYVPVKSGFTNDGMSFNGSMVPYSRIQYFTFEPMQGKDEVRIRATSARKDISMIFTKDEAELARAYFSKNEIPDFDSYRVSQRTPKEK